MGHLCRATQDGRVTVESSEKMWSTEEQMANHISCPENPMNSIKRQKDITQKDEPTQASRYPTRHWKKAEK